MSADAPRLALIGCGAIAESFHAAALKRRPALCPNVVTVDPDIERAERLAGRLGAARVASDYREVLGDVDGAIVSVPHHLHVPITLECLRRKIHVLCEKPIAETVGQVDTLIATAAASGVTVSVNNTKRLYPACQTTKRLIAEGALGRLTNMELVLGEVLAWPAVSGHQFGRTSGGRGVFFDIGAHVVDLACWWLSDKANVVSYRDDSLGGSEAVAELEFVSGTCHGHIRLSWLSKLSNTFRIAGDAGTLDGGMNDYESVWLAPRGRPRTQVTAARKPVDFAGVLLDNFVAVILGQAEPLIPVEEVAPSIAVIEESYARRARFDMPWHVPPSLKM